MEELRAPVMQPAVKLAGYEHWYGFWHGLSDAMDGIQSGSIGKRISCRGNLLVEPIYTEEDEEPET